jgi:hypothetical protein
LYFTTGLFGSADEESAEVDGNECDVDARLDAIPCAQMLICSSIFVLVDAIVVDWKG